jgi:SpoVK/Ycf46/Vps4 family AAA+-type ATPase
MATAKQIKSLVKAYVDGNDEKFITIVLQIAAYEAKLGHEKIACELKALVDMIGKKYGSIVQLNSINPMLEVSCPSYSLSELVVNDGVYDRIKRILNEYRNRHKLRPYGHKDRRKILIEGYPGTGKTMTAHVIAYELKLPLYTVQMDKLATENIGETSAKLRQIFECMEVMIGVYLFDEFDAICADRSLDNEIGERRRILSSFLRSLEQDSSDSIIIAETNKSKMLDHALLRRFDDVLHYSLPSEKEIERLFVDVDCRVTDRLINAAHGLSQADISRVCKDAIKNSILTGEPITQQYVTDLLKERHDIYSNKEA